MKKEKKKKITHCSLESKILLTNPFSLASKAENGRPVKTSSLTKLSLPMIFGNLWRAPTSAASPANRKTFKSKWNKQTHIILFKGGHDFEHLRAKNNIPKTI